MPVLLDGIATVAWAALLGDGGRLFRTRNEDRSTERKPRFFSDILWLDRKTVSSFIILFVCCLPSRVTS
jgi:hypothetical protein